MITDADREKAEQFLAEEEANCLPPDYSLAFTPDPPSAGHSNPTLVCVTLAKSLRRIDALEFALIRIVNAAEQTGLDNMTTIKQIALSAIRQRWSNSNSKQQT